MENHCRQGCGKCKAFLQKFFPSVKSKVSKKVSQELKLALNDLYEMNLTEVKVESHLSLDCQSFVKDVMRTIDEIKSASDIHRFWHIPMEIALSVFSIIEEVVFGDDSECSDMDHDNLDTISTSSDESSDSSDDSNDSESEDSDCSFSDQSD